MPAYVFSIDNVQVHNQKASKDHSDSDWLSIVCTVINPITKDRRVLPAKTYQIGSIIHTGDTLIGPFRSDVIVANDSDVVTVNYLITNLGSSSNEDQFAQAVKVTVKVVEVVAVAVETVFSTVTTGDPTVGIAVGAKIKGAIDAVVSTLSDVFDFLHIHVDAPNCNGEVLHETLTFQPNELKQALGRLASIEYPNPDSPAPPQPERCGLGPHTNVGFSVQPTALDIFVLGRDDVVR